MNKHFLKNLNIVLLLLLALSIGGSFAAWQYAGLQSNSSENEMKFHINTFTYWEGAEILPNEEGESHVSLINNLVNGTDSSGADVGLNNPNSALNQNLENRLNGGPFGIFNRSDCYGSMDGTILDQNIDMEGVFNTDTLGLSFIIQVIDDLTYYVFTTSVDLGESGKPNVALGERIYPIYRSVLVRESTSADFVVQSTQVGSAKSSYYKQLSNSAWLHDQTVPAFDVESWQAYEDEPMGTSNANAIWTFAGDNSAASAEDAVSTVYFKLDDAGARTITSENLHAEITVKNASGEVVAKSQALTVNDKLVVTVSFTIPDNEVYYLEFTGSNYIQFTVN